MSDHCTCTEPHSGTRFYLDANKTEVPCQHCGKHSRPPNREQRRESAANQKRAAKRRSKRYR